MRSGTIVATAWFGSKSLATASLLLLLSLLLLPNNVAGITNTAFGRDPAPHGSSSFSARLNQVFACDVVNCPEPPKMAVNVVLLGCGLVGKAVLKMLVGPYYCWVSRVSSLLYSQWPFFNTVCPQSMAQPRRRFIEPVNRQTNLGHSTRMAVESNHAQTYTRSK